MDAALIIIPILAYLALVIIYAPRLDILPVLEAMIKAYLTVFGFIALSTEILSLFEGIGFESLLLAWLIFLALCTVVLCLISRRKANFSSLFQLKISLSAKCAAAAMVCILVGTLAVALLYPPNNWDSMTYHMSRVMHWIGDHDIGYYPTSNIRQLYMMPLAEYAILHLQVLCGSDLYANLVQWFSFLVAICLAIKIAAEFGLSGKQQLVSGLMAATLPMAILQASSTQNDLVVSSFIMAFGFFLLRIHRDNRFSDYVFLSLAFGMALFTKGTAYVYCATIGLALGLPIIIKYRRMRASLFKVITGFSLVILVALVMNAGFFSRNYSFIGKPFPSGSGVYFNAKMTPYLFFSNLIRNAALHMGSKNPRFNHAVSIGIKKMLGSQLNDPNISFLDFKLNNVEFSRHEDLAGNLIHMLIASAALLVIPLLWVKGYYRNVIGYSCGVFLGFVLFCLLLRWQPWHSRLQTPLFLMAAPILAITVSSWKNKFAKPVTVLIVAVLFLHSVQFVF